MSTSSRTESADTPTPLFTVIIPTYNRPEMLQQAVASVVAQSCEDWELIIVDDCSPQPVDVPDHRSISVLRNEENRGKSYSINVALGRASGRFITILDDDDAWGEHRLDNARRAHELALVTVCDSVTVTSGPLRTSSTRNAPTRLEKWTLKTRIPSGGAMSVARSICPDFDETLRACEDSDWVFRIQMQTDSIALIESADFIWRVHTGERHLNGLQARIEGRQVLLEKHREFFDRNRPLKARQYSQIGYSYLRTGQRVDALTMAVRSLTTWPNPNALRLGIRGLLPSRARWLHLRTVLRTLGNSRRRLLRRRR